MRNVTTRTRRVSRSLATIALAASLATARASTATASCAGDCDASGEVVVGEIIQLVNIALGTGTLANCPAGDSDASGDVAINDIIAAVNDALQGCTVVGSPTPTPTATATPTAGPLGKRHFVLNQTKSRFSAVFPGGLRIPLGGFQGQTNGVVEPAYIDFDAGIPDPGTGVAAINVTGASEYLFVNSTFSQAGPLVVCLKLDVPVTSAGVIACNGGYDFAINLKANHVLGRVGVDNYTAAQCSADGGELESPNQICAAGLVGYVCRSDADCESAPGAADGTCGLGPAQCTEPESKRGAPCRADVDCDADPVLQDGVCGNFSPHPGACNGPFVPEIGTGNSGPGAVTLAPAPQLGLRGLNGQLSIERALPCGDEGAGRQIPFAVTSASARTVIQNYNGRDGEDFVYQFAGKNFSCANWQYQTSPGCLVLAAPALDQDPQSGGDLITTFEFCAN